MSPPQWMQNVSVRLSARAEDLTGVTTTRIPVYSIKGISRIKGPKRLKDNQMLSHESFDTTAYEFGPSTKDQAARHAMQTTKPL